MGLTAPTTQFGPSRTTEYFDVTCCVMLNPGQMLRRGQVVCRGYEPPSQIAADPVYPNDSPRSAQVFGVYQGDTMTNTRDQVAAVPILARRFGYGVVYAAVRATTLDQPGLVVGGNLAMLALSLLGPTPGTTPVAGRYIGQATATGMAFNPGDVIAPWTGTLFYVLTNAYINCS